MKKESYKALGFKRCVYLYMYKSFSWDCQNL